MTRQHNGYGEPTPFSNWLRGLPSPHDSARISNQNLDYVWHSYREGWLITIEEKRFGATSSPSQRDTHHAVAQLLTAGSGTQIATLRGWRTVEYRGHYVIRFEQTTPDDGWMLINEAPATRADLLRLLNTGRLSEEQKVA